MTIDLTKLKDKFFKEFEGKEINEINKETIDSLFFMIMIDAKRPLTEKEVLDRVFQLYVDIELESMIRRGILTKSGKTFKITKDGKKIAEKLKSKGLIE